MEQHIKLFTNHSAYSQAESSLDKPNVVMCQQENDVHYNALIISDPRLIATYNVEDTSNPTPLYMYISQQELPFEILGADMFNKVEIDGTEVSVQDLDTAQGTYEFSEGEHTVEYTLKDPTMIGIEFDEQTEIPSKVGAAFFLCNNLTNVTIPNSVTSIGVDTFNNCSSLTNVTIGSGVISIGDGAFCFCPLSDAIKTTIATINPNAINCELTPKI